MIIRLPDDIAVTPISAMTRIIPDSFNGKTGPVGAGQSSGFRLPFFAAKAASYRSSEYCGKRFQPRMNLPGHPAGLTRMIGKTTMPVHIT